MLRNAQPRLVSTAATLLLTASVAVAGPVEHASYEVEVGATPVAVEVVGGGRIVAVLLDTVPPTLAWFDSADFSLEPYSVDLPGSFSGSLADVGAGGAAQLAVGGSQLDVLSFDTASVPPPSPGFDTPLGLGGSGGRLTTLTWDGPRQTLWAGDSELESLRQIPLDGSGFTVDSLSAAWPIDLDFVPNDATLVDANTLLIVGAKGDSPRMAAVDLGSPESPILYSLDVINLLDSVPVAVVADGVDTAYVLLEGGEIWEVVGEDLGGDDDDSAGDDDDSAAGDDDDSSGDDDDSASGDDDDDSGAGDDDDSGAGGDDDDAGAGDDDDAGAGDDDDSGAGDDDDSGAGDDDDSGAGDDDDSGGSRDSSTRASEWTFTFLIDDAPLPGIDLAYVEVPLPSAGDDDDSAGDDDDTEGTAETTPYLYALGGNVLSVFTPDGAQSQAIVLGGSSGALGLGSGSDGLAYVMRPEDEVLEIVTAGPWVEILSASPTVLASASDTLDLSFSVAFGNDLSGSCTYAATVDAHAADGGTPVSSATGTASSTAPTSLSLSGADLLAGSHRLFITCADAEGDEGSASVPYSLGTLVAPSDFAAVPGDELVTLSWSDLSDGSADHYLLYFDDATFEATTDPVECTTEGLSCSPLVVTADIEAAGDDDDDDDDDDDSADGGSAEAATVSLVVSPLTNDIPWFFAVAAVDADGNIGPRSSILSVTPSVTGGAAALAGDPGGCGCTVSHFSSGPRSLLALGVLLGASFLLVGTRRRRRRLRP